MLMSMHKNVYEMKSITPGLLKVLNNCWLGLQTASYFCHNCSHVTWTNRKGDFDLNVLYEFWEKVQGGAA